jgi:hypothetical protein
MIPISDEESDELPSAARSERELTPILAEFDEADEADGCADEKESEFIDNDESKALQLFACQSAAAASRHSLVDSESLG